MPQMIAQTRILDRMAIGLSGLCVVHCLATAAALALVASAGGMLGAPIIHELGLTLAMLLGLVGLGRGVVTHGYLLPISVGAIGVGVMAGALQMPHDGSEALFTIVGVAILALGHQLNRIAAD